VKAEAWVARICPVAPPPDARIKIKKPLIGVGACVLSAVFSLAAHGQQLFKGQICLGPKGSAAASDKSQVQCDVPRVKRGDHFVFVNLADQAVYEIDGRKNPRPFAGLKVIVVGSLDKRAGTVDITDMYQALSPKVMSAKSVYIDCDACPRAMAGAWRAAFDSLSEWGRFDILPDPMKADLILVVSANPYLGDYLTRDGPDKRPVNIATTYMNVVDPHTGESLWGDSKELGSWLVARSTKDLVNEFRDELKLDESVGKT
jgi:hypothetical protein